MDEKHLTEKESLQLITEMINKAKYNYHESGTSAILWGSVIAFCGLFNFAEIYFKFSLGFDVWLLALIALIPQIFISIRESRKKKVITHTEAAVSAVWVVFTISIFALIFYVNIVPGVADRYYEQNGVRIIQVAANNTTTTFHNYVPSANSIFLLIYAFPTLATGLMTRFRPMVAGAAICYILFVISCFLPTRYDILFNGLAGIFNWLIPGIILRTRYIRKKNYVNENRG